MCRSVDRTESRRHADCRDERPETVAPIGQLPTDRLRIDPVQGHAPSRANHGRMDTAADNPAADLLIVGAGPAGLALACAAADAGLRATVLEQQPRVALAEPTDDGREIALTHRGRQVLQRLGLWARLPPGLPSPLREARVADGAAAATLHFGSTRGGDPLGWLVPNHALRAACWAGAMERERVTVLTDAAVKGLQRDALKATLVLADSRHLTAPLVVAADSRFSGTRRLAGIGAAMRDFGRSVIVAPVAHERPHQGIAWECFRYGHTLALLPMADGETGPRSSVVVTVPSDAVPDWLALNDAAFSARAQAASGGVVGALQPAGTRHAYPLVGVYAHRFVAERFALVGDAAVGMHPVTAHGYNFGLYGVEVLVQALQRHGLGTGLSRALAAYDTEHRRVTWPTYHGTNLVVSLFTDERPLARRLRPAVLALAERAPGLSQLVHRAIERQLTARPG
jgi:ubiquinone biosynthesis UbiH/UbiF/VisC/COQ6 family hydroxylase